MAAWSDGYFTEVQYLGKFFPHMAPGSLAFACLRQGVRPPELGAGSTYLELGCGQGFGLNLLAAANPRMTFWGIDFHPGQIANAQRLAQDAGLANVTFDDLSFEQVLALPEGRIPRCDVIALHGVLSWVGPEHRAQIVRILDRHLKPGGLVSVSYNTLPGWAALMPLRRFVKEHFERSVGPPETRALNAFRSAKEMLAHNARGFGPPQVKAVIDQALAGKPAYLLHEYLNDHFHPLFHADVARELDAARLTFAASSHMADDLLALAAPEPMHGLIKAETDPVWRETLTDYANSRRFRTDVFVRGRNPLGAADRDARLRQVRFELIRCAEQVKFEFEIPMGSLTGDPALYGAVVAALADGPLSWEELAKLPAFAKGPDGLLMKVVGLLMSVEVIAPGLAGDIDATAGRAFNRAVLSDLTFETPPTHLAAGAIGSGVRLGFTDLIALSAPAASKPDHAATARRGWALMARTGARFTKDGKALSGQEAHEAELVKHLTDFEVKKRALYTRLGVA